MIKIETVRYGGALIQSPLTSADASPTPIVGDPLADTYMRPDLHFQSRPLGDDFYIVINTFNPWIVPLDNPSRDTPGQHGELRGANTMKSREVAIKGEIYTLKKNGRMRARNILNEIFSPDPTPSMLRRGFKRVEFDDQYGDKWFFTAQVLSRLVDFTDETWQYFVTPFTVRLVSDGDARIFSDELFEVELDEGFIAGMQIGSASNSYGQNRLNAYWNATSVQSQGNWPSPAVFTLQIDPAATNPVAHNPIITNYTTGAQFKLNYTLNPGETIVVDGFQSLVFLNGSPVNIAQVGSRFPTIAPGVANQIVVSDETHPWIFNKAIDAKVEYRKAII